MQTITKESLLAFQLKFYAERLKQETRPEAKRLLRQTLYHLKNPLPC